MSASERTNSNPTGGHGGGVRGDAFVDRSAVFEGRFGRMFRNLPPASWPEDELHDLAHGMTAKPEHVEGHPNEPAAAFEDPNLIIQDPEENPGIAAGYTYFGQFVDHDITFDPASSLMQENDPNALIDFRTPRLDLDSMYGRGPDDQPYLYSGNKFRFGRRLFEGTVATNRRDLPRFTVQDETESDQRKRALIGDKRNDENVIVSQLHGSFMRFHNRLVDVHKSYQFADIQQLVRWHYQWLVINDYLTTICGTAVVDSILPNRLTGGLQSRPALQFYHPHNKPYMPIEFSAAAYRWGHSAVRPIYRLNTELNMGDGPVATADEEANGLAGRLFIFAGVQGRGLNGFDEFPAEWGIDWSLFFDAGDGAAPRPGKQRVQPAYKIDSSLVNPLGFLPEFSKIGHDDPPLTVEKLQAHPVGPSAGPANLAVRNLLRGQALALPSGQAVAEAMGIPHLADEEIIVGKSTTDDPFKKITDFGESFKGSAPLWLYILAEARHQWLTQSQQPGGLGELTPTRLGPVGARIVAETIIGLIWGDGFSYLQQFPNWKPTIRHHGAHPDVTLDTVGKLVHWANADE